MNPNPQATENPEDKKLDENKNFTDQNFTEQDDKFVLYCYGKFKADFDSGKSSKSESEQKKLIKKIRILIREDSVLKFDCFLKVVNFTEFLGRAENLIKGIIKKRKIKYPNFVTQLDSFKEISDSDSKNSHASGSDSEAGSRDGSKDNLGKNRRKLGGRNGVKTFHEDKNGFLD